MGMRLVNHKWCIRWKRRWERGWCITSGGVVGGKDESEADESQVLSLLIIHTQYHRWPWTADLAYVG